jgi:Domain of unknown function (DUF4416)
MVLNPAPFSQTKPMGTIRKPQDVKIFAGLITVSEMFASKVLKELEEKFGPSDVKSPLINFDFTDYYSGEMGGSLLRQWVGFKTLIDPGKLPEIKSVSGEIEEKYAVSGKRTVNIDPGYLTPAKIVLASSKDYSHRIYLSGGIYGEVTLIYKNKQFIPLDWTYPDYKSVTAGKFFLELREIFAKQFKNAG